MVTYFYWWYAEEPAYLWHAINIVTKKIFYSFSITLLLRTLFDPWKRDITSSEGSIQTVYQVWLNNLVSRFVGFMVRLLTIIAGFIVTIIFYLIALLFFFIWLLLPVIIIYLIIHGFQNI